MIGNKEQNGFHWTLTAGVGHASLPRIIALNTKLIQILFLHSNAGASMINKKSIAHWKKGLPREDIRLKDMERAITTEVFNEGGDLANFSPLQC